MVDPRAFAFGELPWWPIVGYVWLTVVGLVALGLLLAVGVGIG